MANPTLLLDAQLKALRLPTFLREYAGYRLLCARSKVLVYETMRDIARRMWDKPPFLLGGAHRVVVNRCARCARPKCHG